MSCDFIQSWRVQSLMLGRSNSGQKCNYSGIISCFNFSSFKHVKGESSALPAQFPLLCVLFLNKHDETSKKLDHSLSFWLSEHGSKIARKQHLTSSRPCLWASGPNHHGLGFYGRGKLMSCGDRNGRFRHVLAWHV